MLQYDDISTSDPTFSFFSSRVWALLFGSCFGLLIKSKKYTSTVVDNVLIVKILLLLLLLLTHNSNQKLSIKNTRSSINQYTGARCVSMNQEILSASKDEVNVVVVISFTSLVVVVVVVAKEKHVPS